MNLYLDNWWMFDCKKKLDYFNPSSNTTNGILSTGPTNDKQIKISDDYYKNLKDFT